MFLVMAYGIPKGVTRAAYVVFILSLLAGEAQEIRAQERRPLLVETEESERLLRKARRELFDFRMPAATQTLHQLARRPDGAVAARHHQALVALLKGLVTDEDAYLDTFFEHSDALEEQLEEVPETPWRAYLEAEGTLHRVIARIKTEQYMRAAWGARSAFKQYEVLAQNEASPVYYDAQMGWGLLHAVVGSLPGGWRRFLRFLGYDGSVVAGREELERAATQSRLHQLPAGLMLSLVDLSLFRDLERARQRLAQLHRRHPESLLVSHLYGLALLDSRHAGEAVDVLRAAVRRAASKEYFYLNYLDYYLAQALFRTDDFRGAAKYYRQYLNRHDGPALKAIAHLHLGEALEMQGRRAEALRHYRQVETSREFDSDRAARRAAKQHVQAPMTSHERTLLLGQGAYDSGRYARADSLLGQVFRASSATAAERGEAAYRRGRVYQAREQWGKAVQAYRFAIARPGDPQAKWAPWSQFYLGEVYEARGQQAKARAAYEKALEYEDFDYAQSLEQAVRSALDRLEKE